MKHYKKTAQIIRKCYPEADIFITMYGDVDIRNVICEFKPRSVIIFNEKDKYFDMLNKVGELKRKYGKYDIVIKSKPDYMICLDLNNVSDNEIYSSAIDLKSSLIYGKNDVMDILLGCSSEQSFYENIKSRKIKIVQPQGIKNLPLI